jgi:sigma-B regulation protein RsbU (phosphoserine phosphatase)
MLTGIVKSAFRASHADDYEPLCVVDRVWNTLMALGSERFVTLLALVVAAEEHQLIYVNAGHPAGLLWADDHHTARLESTGPIVSPALPASRWERLIVPIREGDQLLLYTDGISEALVGDNEFGENRIKAAIEQHAGGGGQLLDAILADLARHLGSHPQTDDLTLMTARVLQSNGDRLPTS